MSDLLNPIDKAIIFEDVRLYVVLATYPVTVGHTVVVWKTRVVDLHLLKRGEYEYLLEIVDKTRDALLKTLKIKKVYLVYMDEIKHVHWHLIPRYNEKGFNVFKHKPDVLKDFSLSKKIKNNLKV